jgi:hypothetical protein
MRTSAVAERGTGSLEAHCLVLLGHAYCLHSFPASVPLVLSAPPEYTSGVNPNRHSPYVSATGDPIFERLLLGAPSRISAANGSSVA